MEPPKRFIERLLDLCITLAISAFLLRLAVRWVVEIWPYLLTIIVIISVVIIAYRVWKHLHDGGMGKW